MKRPLRSLACGVAAASFALFAAGEAQAQTSFELGDPACTLGTVTSGGVGYTSCFGSFAGNNEPPSAVLGYLAGEGIDATYAGKTDSGMDSGPFEMFANSSTGTLTLRDAIMGPFVVALKGGPRFSLYYFAGDGPWTSIAYDMLGVRSPAPGLSHASLYTVGSEVVTPEPGTMALLLLGFAGLGFVAWRREGVATA